MSRHAADKPRTASENGRLRNYTEIEREEGGPRRQTLDLQRRPRGERDDTRRTAEYLRIDRGRTA